MVAGTNYLTNYLRGRCIGAALLLVTLGQPAIAAEVAEAGKVAAALPEDIPEEILRTEIITGARSPLTGEPISAADYAQLQAELAAPAGGNLVNQDLRYLIYLLQLRRAVKPIIPFL